MNMEHILISMNTDNYKERMKELFKFDNNICGLGVNKIPAMKNGYESYISFVLDENKVENLEDLKKLIAIALKFLKYYEDYTKFSIKYEVIMDNLIVSMVVS
ncbi:hypothetical protein BFS06_14170 [Clostridium perfringens]|uniref:Uncharacterized protein n=2 Tax=Clostridium perfringens TaxID=1502 RepID=A0A140GRH8_CLOPF|nr:hypothetical protein [Clostridium perfringens]AMN31137.1 hypothetical protein JFP838_pA0221 [Clostridium perfringens]TBX14352.1 hypothetical protein BFS06_14170 [Clostridium perfringens]